MLKIYPDCSAVLRIVKVGGLSKQQLLGDLRQHAVQLNEYGRMLLDDEEFKVAEEAYSLQTVEVTVAHLGFPDGATTPEIYHRAGELGLELCPLELASFLRLQYLDQPEAASKQTKHPQAPYGSITIASERLKEDDEFPKGFYLRNVEGALWLRGYCADDLHVWNAGDHFIFCKKGQV